MKHVEITDIKTETTACAWSDGDSQYCLSGSAVRRPYVAWSIVGGEMGKCIWRRSRDERLSFREKVLRTRPYNSASVIISIVAEISRLRSPRHVNKTVKENQSKTKCLAEQF